MQDGEPASEVELCQAGDRAKREENNGGRLSASHLCLSDQKLYTGKAPHLINSKHFSCH